MLFNSYVFLGVFLPITLLVFFTIKKKSAYVILVWLLFSSLFFYGYWKPIYLLIIVISIVANYVASIFIYKNRSVVWLFLFVLLNLVSIGYFKYSEFLWLSFFSNADVPELIAEITLPLAISFFTFQQIAYLVDVNKGRVKPGGFYNYALYVSFFPQLIAGPIVRYQELSPQLLKIGELKTSEKTIMIGVVFFTLGLAKKVLLADTLSPYANDIFSYASQKGTIGFVDAWSGAYTYTFQLYFDFSGYSDMAIGLAFLFGIKLPTNFNSPYKSNNIIEFWRRWHITLSRFFRDYVYIPLGGNRKGYFRHVCNTSFVMLLTGVWHGAGWTFIFWGGYHCILIVTTHLVKSIVTKQSYKTRSIVRGGFVKSLGVFVTFHLVVFGWVLFRAENFDVALVIIKSMLLITNASTTALIDTSLYEMVAILIFMSCLVCFFLPNSSEIVSLVSKVTSKKLMFSGGILHYIFWLTLGAAFYLSITTISQVNSDFLYFNF